MKRTTRHNENVELESRSLADLGHGVIAWGQGSGLFAATPTTFSWKEPMQPTRQAPHTLGPPHQPGRRTTSVVASLKGALLRQPPPFCFFAPETSKVTLVVT